MTTEPPLDESAGSVYGTFIEAQLAEERITKSSLEARGITVITTAGSIVGLLFALLALFSTDLGLVLPAESKGWLIVALVLLTAASIGGLLVNVPSRYKEANPKDLEALIFGEDGEWANDWTEPKLEGSRRVADINLQLLKSARAKNSIKARFLRLTLLVEVLGIAGLAVAASKAL